jgi:hypothetical protein
MRPIVAAPVVNAKAQPEALVHSGLPPSPQRRALRHQPASTNLISPEFRQGHVQMDDNARRYLVRQLKRDLPRSVLSCGGALVKRSHKATFC